MTRLLKIKEAASLLSCSERTIERWIKDGKLDCLYLPCGKRITEDQLEDFIQKLNPHVAITSNTTTSDLARHGL